MKRLDYLILRELVGPWFFGVGLFTVLIVAGSFLFTASNYFVQGASLASVAEFLALVIPGVMVKTFAMAVLLSTLLAFGRLSSDSEIVAIKAAGTSLPRIMAPVALFGILVAFLAFFTDETVVSAAAKKADALKDQISKHLTGSTNAVTQAIYDKDGVLREQLMSLDFNIGEQRLERVTITIFDSHRRPTALIYAPGMQFHGDVNQWRLDPGAQVNSFDGRLVMPLSEAYPENLGPPPGNPDDILATQLKDLDAFNMRETKQAIAKLESDTTADRHMIANLWYGYYNKIALPLAALIFGLVGAPLGIRNHRTGAASGFWLSVVIIFAYMMLANLMNSYAMGQKIPPYMASFTPIVVGLVAAIVLIYQKDR